MFGNFKTCRECEAIRASFDKDVQWMVVDQMPKQVYFKYLLIIKYLKIWF